MKDEQPTRHDELLAAGWLHTDTLKRIDALEKWIDHPETGLVVKSNEQSRLIDGLRNLPVEIREEIRVAIETIDGKRAASWTAVEKVLIALITVLGATLTAWLAKG